MPDYQRRSPSEISTGRYLLYLDLLGFKELVRKSSVERVYAVVDETLKHFGRWEKMNQQFRTIYFSDTIIYYQVPAGWAEWAFLDVYALSGMLLSALLARGIPARGVISFGQLEVRLASDGRHEVFFGGALIEAHQAEPLENWIGITIQPSAWKGIPKAEAMVRAYETDGVWRTKSDGALQLNPLIKLRGTYDEFRTGQITKGLDEWNEPESPNDLRALRFVFDEVARFAAAGDVSSRIASKYHVTLAFLKDILGEELFEWANIESHKLSTQYL